MFWNFGPLPSNVFNQKALDAWLEENVLQACKKQIEELNIWIEDDDEVEPGSNSDKFYLTVAGFDYEPKGSGLLLDTIHKKFDLLELLSEWLNPYASAKSVSKSQMQDIVDREQVYIRIKQHLDKVISNSKAVQITK